MKERIRKNTSIVLLGVLSIVYFTMLIVKKSVPDVWEKDFLSYIIWIYFFASFTSWLNRYELCVERKIICICDVIVQLTIFIIINWILQCPVELNYLYLIYVFIILLIGIELALHICMPCKEKEHQKDKNELLEEEMYDVILDGLLEGLHIRQKKYNNKRLEYRTKVSVYNALAFLILIIAYGFKYVLDIINMWAETYRFPVSIIYIYIVFLLIFVWLETAKARLLKYPIYKSLFIIISCVMGVYMFVFMQPGNVRFRILICSMYLVSPYLRQFFYVVKHVQLEEKEL